MTTGKSPLSTPHGSLLSARVTNEQIEAALRLAIKGMPREGHVSWAHPSGSGRGFEYRPEVCAECRLRVLQALHAGELLYV